MDALQAMVEETILLTHYDSVIGSSRLFLPPAYESPPLPINRRLSMTAWTESITQ